MVIAGNSVYLEKFALQHLENQSYYNWLCDIEVVKYIGRKELIDGISYKSAVKYVKEIWLDNNTLFFAIHDKNSKDFIGTAKLNFFDKTGMKSGIADVGIMIGERSFWGRGIGTDTVKTLSQYAFSTLNARKLTAGGISSNFGIVKAFKKAGYTEEGFLKHHFYIDGKYHDQILFACFPND